MKRRGVYVCGCVCVWEEKRLVIRGIGSFGASTLIPESVKIQFFTAGSFTHQRYSPSFLYCLLPWLCYTG